MLDIDLDMMLDSSLIEDANKFDHDAAKAPRQ
jgi:hypothetical protein